MKNLPMRLSVTARLFIAFLPVVIGCSAGGAVRQEPINPRDLAVLNTEEAAAAEPEKLLALAEFYYGSQKFPESLACIQRVLVFHEGTIYADRAYFIKGRVYADILNFHRDVKKAASAFRMVISSPPESRYDKMAEKELERIKK